MLPCMPPSTQVTAGVLFSMTRPADVSQANGSLHFRTSPHLIFVSQLARQIVTCRTLEACRSVELLQNSVRLKANRNDGQFAESAATAHPSRQGPSLFSEKACVGQRLDRRSWTQASHASDGTP